MRLVGRRTTSRLTPSDLIVLSPSAGATITAVPGDDHPTVAAVSTVATIGLTHVAVSWPKVRPDRFGRRVDGTPVLIYEHGRWHERRMRHLRIGRSDVMGAGRGRGTLAQIRSAAFGADRSRSSRRARHDR